MGGNYFFGEIHVLVTLLRKGEGPFSLKEICEIADFIFNESNSLFYRSSGSMFDVSVIESYPELFRKGEKNGEVAYFRGEKLPNLEYFFCNWPENMISYFSRFIDDYFERKNAPVVYSRQLKAFVSSKDVQ